MSELEYMPYVTNNVATFIPNKLNVVACVYCRNIYEAYRLSKVHNCLVCRDCQVDAVMVVEHSPLRGLSAPEQQALLEKWHVDGFTLIPREKKVYVKVGENLDIHELTESKTSGSP
jgi:hypothetical protein